MNHNSKHRLLTAALLLLSFTATDVLSKNDRSNGLAKPSVVEYDLFSGNNISNWMDNIGHLSSHIPTGDAGTEWPSGSGKTSIFTSGIWVTGQVGGEIRSAVAEYTSQWTPGKIPYDTQTKQPISSSPINTNQNQIYYVRKGDSSNPASDSYNREFATWPASDGAPSHDGELFSDLNQNGIREIDENFEDFNNDGTYN
ncbi:MAG: hypothetical protein HOG76_10075, partial [Candidatus Marinimicrobia bacterium]|nr:hypothetical protein [Candidatus Neomarinimicrobiota bacterium]MBT5465863.1 hypothetical protein [Candidatus Neomarinimicrobiota bacterium]MBT6003169.1 hypothetical protein [Candidatus Neomarinimicrobiota bacterium]MBT7686079.1 hypothetical protein [Candidatus Neomarinimicrobiota bacterium]